MTTEDLKFREFGLAESGLLHGLCLDDGGRQRPFLLKIEEGAPLGTPAYGYVMAMAKGFPHPAAPGHWAYPGRGLPAVSAGAVGGVGLGASNQRRATAPAAAGEARAEVEREDAETGAGFPRKLPIGATEMAKGGPMAMPRTAPAGRCSNISISQSTPKKATPPGRPVVVWRSSPVRPGPCTIVQARSQFPKPASPQLSAESSWSPNALVEE